MENKLFLISGTSGVGKTTIAYKLMEQIPNLKRLVTYVTREARPGEVDGVDYHFVTVEQFKQKLADGDFFENAEHYGNYYGNSLKDLEKIWDDGNTAMAVLDVKGVNSTKAKFPNAKSIFILPDNLENLKKRIRQRPMSDEAFEKRWELIPEEMKQADSYDFQVVNEEGKVEQATAKIKQIINGS
ncbi:guanylate kinase [Candidatus Kuenenbacteria bacterium]|nr:guanylate kinase [Candidatus Kuenenbacteria bacterium]